MSSILRCRESIEKHAWDTPNVGFGYTIVVFKPATMPFISDVDMPLFFMMIGKVSQTSSIAIFGKCGPSLSKRFDRIRLRQRACERDLRITCRSLTSSTHKKLLVVVHKGSFATEPETSSCQWP